MTKLTALQAISAGVVKDIVSQIITANNDGVYLGVWPAGTTNTPRADAYQITPIRSVYMVVGQGDSQSVGPMPVPNSLGEDAVYLMSNTLVSGGYPFYFDPAVNTLGFVAADASDNVPVHLQARIVR